MADNKKYRIYIADMSDANDPKMVSSCDVYWTKDYKDIFKESLTNEITRMINELEDK